MDANWRRKSNRQFLYQNLKAADEIPGGAELRRDEGAGLGQDGNPPVQTDRRDYTTSRAGPGWCDGQVRSNWPIGPLEVPDQRPVQPTEPMGGRGDETNRNA